MDAQSAADMEKRKLEAQARTDRENLWFTAKIKALKPLRKEKIAKAYPGYLVVLEEQTGPDGKVRKVKKECDLIPERIHYTIHNQKNGIVVKAHYPYGPEGRLVPVLIQSKYALYTPFGWGVYKGSEGQNQQLIFSLGEAERDKQAEEFFEMLWAIEQTALMFFEANELKITTSRDDDATWEEFIRNNYNPKSWTLSLTKTKDGRKFAPQIALKVVVKRDASNKAKQQLQRDGPSSSSSVVVQGASSGSDAYEYTMKLYDGNFRPVAINESNLGKGSRCFIFFTFQGLSFVKGMKPVAEAYHVYVKPRESMQTDSCEEPLMSDCPMFGSGMSASAPFPPSSSSSSSPPTLDEVKQEVKAASTAMDPSAYEVDNLKQLVDDGALDYSASGGFDRPIEPPKTVTLPPSTAATASASSSKKRTAPSPPPLAALKKGKVGAK